MSSSPSFQKCREEEAIIKLPSNLKIDPRATCSPFFGLDRVAEEESSEEEEHVDDSSSYAEEEEVLYSLKPTALTELVYVVPLPQRLTVPVHSLNSGIDNNGSHSHSTTSTATMQLSPVVFGIDTIRTDILHRVVVYQRNKKRGKRYPAITKTISTKSGSGKKMRPQKGGGTARAGHRRPAHWRGGAKAHGPKGIVQDYTTKLNKKVRQLGLRHALSQKLKEGNLIVVKDFSVYSSSTDISEADSSTTNAEDNDTTVSFKTKDLARAMSKFDIHTNSKTDVGASALLVDDADKSKETTVGGVPASLKLASRNLYKLRLLNQHHTNVYDVLKYEKLVLSVQACKALEERLGV